MPIVYIDANAFIDLVEGIPERNLRLETFFEALRATPGAAVTSNLTRAEVLGTEAPVVGWEKQKDFYRGLFDLNGFLDTKPVSRAILAETGDLRRSARHEGRQVTLVGTIRLATAISLDCRYFLSSDRCLTWPAAFRFVAPNGSSFDQILASLDA